MFKPNIGKKLEIEVNNALYCRYPLKTNVFKNGDNYVSKIGDYSVGAMSKLFVENNKIPDIYVIISEKIVAISQGRSFFIKDIKPRKLAVFLSKYVKKTPHGIGLGSKYTMELALREVGVFKIIIASMVSAMTKIFGISGVFYHIAGREAASIDGPTEYSLYPSNVSAKLGPKNPDKVCNDIYKYICKKAPEFLSEKLKGVVVIDANDLGRVVLGNKSNQKNAFFEEVMQDNPMGQGSEQTPIVIAFEKI